MKLPEDTSVSMWEQIASKPKADKGPKIKPGMRTHRWDQRERGPEAYKKALENLRRLGILK